MKLQINIHLNIYLFVDLALTLSLLESINNYTTYAVRQSKSTKFKPRFLYRIFFDQPYLMRQE